MIKSKPSNVVSVLSPNGIVIGTIGSLVKHSEDNEATVLECSRFCFSNFSIAEYFQGKKRFSVLIKTDESEHRQDDCFIEDHSFCHTPSVADTVKIKAYKPSFFNTQDAEEYEKWLESRFVW